MAHLRVALTGEPVVEGSWHVRAACNGRILIRAGWSLRSLHRLCHQHCIHLAAFSPSSHASYASQHIEAVLGWCRPWRCALEFGAARALPSRLALQPKTSKSLAQLSVRSSPRHPSPSPVCMWTSLALAQSTRLLIAPLATLGCSADNCAAPPPITIVQPSWSD